MSEDPPPLDQSAYRVLIAILRVEIIVQRDLRLGRAIAPPDLIPDGHLESLYALMRHLEALAAALPHN